MGYPPPNKDKHHLNNQDRNINKHIANIGKFDWEQFYRTLFSHLYANITHMDTRNKYNFAYEFFRRLQGKPLILEPEPLPPDRISGDITDEQLECLEADIAVLFEYNIREIKLITKSVIAPILESILKDSNEYTK